jgi:RNA polymerase sigma-70 factor (ECF subfamily)
MNRESPDKRLNDQELIRKITAGDEAAFKHLVDLYHTAVIGTCYRILGNREDAEDVAQEAFVQVHRKVSSFRGDSKLSTWLYRVAVNLSLNQLRKKKWNSYFGILTLSERRVEEAAGAVEAPAPSRPDRAFEADERARLLSEALAALPEKQRAAIVLHKSEGLSHEEVAQVLGVSISSVESLIHRARRKLQKKLLRSVGNP